MEKPKFANSKPRILLGVTVDDSWILLDGFPERLVEAGWIVHLVSSPGPRLEEYASMPGIEVHDIPMNREMSPLQDLRSLAKWISLMRNVKLDVVSVGTPKAGLLGMLSARLVSNAKRVYILRGLRLETETGIKRSLLSFIEQLTMNCAEVIVSVSESLQKLVISMGLVQASKIRVIGLGSSNGVETSKFSKKNYNNQSLENLKQQLNLTSELPIIGFVGRLNTDKGLETLLEATLQLFSQKVFFQLLIVGARESDFSSHSLEHVSKLPQVTFTGKVDFTGPYYQLMDILVLPTFREGFPNVVLEAQASGVPVVTTFATGAIDSILNEVTGCLIEPGDAEQLARKLEIFIKGSAQYSPDECISWSKKFERKIIQKQQLDFYNELILSKSNVVWGNNESQG